MLLKSIKSQTAYIMQRRLTVLTWCFLCGFVLVNLVHSILICKDRMYITEMYDMVKMLTLSTSSQAGHFLMFYYPLLVVLPTSTLILDDKNSQMQLYLVGRLDRKNYYIGKTIAVFLSTVLIFTLPFLMELLASLACFHVSSFGDPSNWEHYIYTPNIKENILWPELYIKSRIGYAVLRTVLFGLISGVLAVFNFALTTFPVFKHKIATMVPVWLLLMLFSLVGRRVDLGYTTYYIAILQFFRAQPSELNPAVYGTALALLAVISMGIIAVKIKRDDFT